MVTGGIARRIGLGLNDATGEPPGGEIVNDDFADKKARKSDGVLR